MIIELPVELETALKAQANARGVSAAGLVREILERDLAGGSSERLSASGSELVAAMQASPFKEISLESMSERAPVREVQF
jgi:plasmid stability protein